MTTWPALDNDNGDGLRRQQQQVACIDNDDGDGLQTTTTTMAMACAQ